MAIKEKKVQNTAPLGQGERLRFERKRLNLTLVRMAEIGGVSRSSQILYEKGKPAPSDYLERIAAAGADVLYILTGESKDEWMRRPSDTGSGDIIEATNPATPETLPMGYVLIQWGDLSYKGIAPVAVSRAWIHRQELDAENLRWNEMQDCSMEPTIPRGALLLTEQREPQPLDSDNDVWVFRSDEGRGVARLSFLGKTGIIVTHDNPALTPTLRQDIKPIGRVIWSGHVLK